MENNEIPEDLNSSFHDSAEDVVIEFASDKDDEDQDDEDKDKTMIQFSLENEPSFFSKNRS